MSTIFWDVDTQYDFIHADGKLYVPGSETIIPALARLTDAAHRHGVRIIASSDDHVDSDPELSAAPDYRTTFPPHCMRGTPGQRKIPETALRHPWTIEPDPIPEGELQRLVREHPGDILFLKHRFDVFTNPNVEPVVRALAPTRVVLYGVALDVCDRFAVEGLLARFPDLELSLVTDAVKAIDPAAGSALLNEWQARGVALITTTQAVESLA